MKKLISLLAIALVLVACNSDEPKAKAFVIDPMATIAIKPDMNAYQSPAMKIKSSTKHLSALEIVKQTDAMTFVLSDGARARGGFAPEQRDTISEIPMLKMWGTAIMSYSQLIDGTYTTNLVLTLDFLEAKNCVLITAKGDTIAYVPNTVLRTAETQIKALFAEKNYEPIYTIFNNAYTFIPITGAEYRALNQE